MVQWNFQNQYASSGTTANTFSPIYPRKGARVCRKTSEKRFTQRRGDAKNAKKKKKEFVILYNIRNYHIFFLCFLASWREIFEKNTFPTDSKGAKKKKESVIMSAIISLRNYE